MSVPSIDVVISAFNAAKTLSATLASLAGQSDGNFSVIIYDDASTDGTSQLALDWQSVLRIHLVQGSVRRGPGLGRNAGVRLSDADYVCFIDADDLVLPNHVATLRREAQAGHAIIASRAYQWVPSLAIGDTRRGKRQSLSPLPLSLPEASDQWPAILRENFMFGASAVRREVFWYVNGFREGVMEDWDLWIRLMRCGFRAVMLEDATYIYRVSFNSRGRAAESFAIKMAVLDAAATEMESECEWPHIQLGRRQLEALRHLDDAIERGEAGSGLQARLSALNAWRAPTWRTRAAAIRRTLLG